MRGEMLVHGIDVATALALILAGLVAGFLNTVASSGSAVTLPVMIALGLSPVEANATNRVPIVVGCAVAVWKFHQAGQLPWRLATRLSAPMLIGGIIGVTLAANLTEMRTAWLTTFAVALAATVVLSNPAKWLNADRPDAAPNTGLVVLALLGAVGFWGGLIALDSATFALAVLVLVAHLPIREANAIKLLGFGLVALVAVIAFSSEGDIDWLWALPLSVGGVAGSLVGTRVSLGPNASRWIFWLLVVVLSAEAIRLGIRFL